MSKLKKLLMGIAIAAAAVCVTGAVVGCSSKNNPENPDDGTTEVVPNYYTLVFEGKGYDCVFQGALAPEDSASFVSGGTVKEGVEVKFSIALGQNTEGTPTVYVNDAALSADESGVYSFTMAENTIVRVGGITSKNTVTFSKGDYRIKYLDEKGEELDEEVLVSDGASIKFKLWVSPYYAEGYEVVQDSEELDADENGYYTLSNVTASTTVNLERLEQAESFATRESEEDGSGTADDPYIIKTPIDMYYFASLVNSEWYLDYSSAYYRLDADIDMDGETLYTIGSYTNTSAIFCGSFDGNGHTIKNFVLTDEFVDQDTYLTSYLPYVGLFGYAAATTSSPAVIKNLTLKDYTVEIHPAKLGSSTASYTGTIVGMGVGVQITNCHVSGGKITSTGNNSNMAYIGGIAGLLQSAYRDDSVANITYDAFVRDSSADINIRASQTAYSIGGIVGYMYSADSSAITYVTNCTATGSLYGAMNAGGIAGSLGRYCSVTNCYADNNIYASNRITASVDSAYKVAYAGGIVGYAENDTVIYGCYAANTAVTAIETWETASDITTATGDFVGALAEAATDAADSRVSVVVNNIKKSSFESSEISALGWVASDWDLSDSVPVPVANTAVSAVTVSVYNGSTKVNEYTRSAASAAPIYTWYSEDVMPEYIFSGTNGTYGYYFDEELTKRVPYGFVPTGNVKLYVGYADYSDVAGTYYLGETTYGVDAHFKLSTDGTVSFRDGGMTFEGVYSYNGETITIYNTSLGLLSYEADLVNGAEATLVMTESGSGYELSGLVFLTETDSSGDTSTESATLSFTAVKVSDSFKYGQYTGTRGSATVTVVFSKNGVVRYTPAEGAEEQEYTFTISESGVVALSNNWAVSINSDGVVTSFNGVDVSALDELVGSWSTSANSAKVYTFDGLRNMTFSDGTTTSSGTYSVTDGEGYITIDGKKTEVKLTSSGTLYIDGKEYFVADGYKGTWYGTYESTDTGTELGSLTETYELELGGIGVDGYGEATITFTSGSTTSYSGQYSVNDGVVYMYVGDTLFAELSPNTTTGDATGYIYSQFLYTNYGTIYYVTVDMSIYDEYKGEWVTNLSDYSTMTFTGKGKEEGGAKVLLSASSGSTLVGTYAITADGATLTIKKANVTTTYAMSLDEESGEVTLTAENTSDTAGTLARRDSWYGVTLYDESGLSYTFDGKGYVGGTVSVSDGTTLSYTFSGSLPTIYGQALTAGESGFAWNEKTLVFKTGFAGTWLTSGDNAEVVIGEVTSSLTAAVTMNGVTNYYTYNPTASSLTYTDGRGATYTIRVLGSIEISISTSEKYTVCISSGNLDGKRGTYTAADGSTWTLDGHGNGKYGSGTAVLKDGETTTECTYTVDTLGNICIRISGTRYLFVKTTEGGYSLSGSSEAYDTVKIDALYLTQLYISDTYYTADGVGNLWTSDESSGVYRDSGYDYARLNSTQAVIIMGEKKYLGVISTTGKTNDVTLNAYAEYTNTADGKKYIIGVITSTTSKTGSVWLCEGSSYTFAYYYAVVSDKEYSLEDSNATEYTLTIDSEDTITISAK